MHGSNIQHPLLIWWPQAMNIAISMLSLVIIFPFAKVWDKVMPGSLETNRRYYGGKNVRSKKFILRIISFSSLFAVSNM